MRVKVDYKGDLLLYPCPTVLITSKDKIDNVFTVSWTGIASSHPEYVTIAINKKRLSYSIILESMKFCINIPDASLINEVDYCGSFSGRDVDKFTACKLDKIYYDTDYILVGQCKMHLLCSVERIIKLGSHDLFIAQVVNKLIDSSISNIHENADPIVYFRPYYYQVSKKTIGHYGFTKSEI